jgi:hypothetical protein
MTKFRLTQIEREMYKGNVDRLIDTLAVDYGGEETKNVVIEINPNLEVRLLEIKGISPELTEEIKNAITGALLGWINNLEEFSPGAVSYEHMTNELQISLMDYIQYVISNNPASNRYKPKI